MNFIKYILGMKRICIKYCFFYSINIIETQYLAITNAYCSRVSIAYISVCDSVCDCVCLSVCLSVCVCARQIQNG